MRAQSRKKVPAMKRSRPSRRARTTPDLEALVRLSQALGHSSSRMEDTFWQGRVSAMVERLLASGDDETLNMALDRLFPMDGRSYDCLADLIEAACENRRGASGKEVLLIAVPALAWSRLSIPSGSIPRPVLEALRVQLQAHVFAADVALGLADLMFSPDQLPETFSEIASLADALGASALKGSDLHIDPASLPETVNFLSDTRYIVGAVAVESGAPVFRWQEDDGDRDEALRRWRIQGGELLRSLLPACAVEMLLPLAFHAACREADRSSRPYALRASVDFLNAVLGVTPAQLTAVAAPFHDRRLEEYRIGLVVSHSGQVVHGTTWPLLEMEDENTDIAGQIEAVLKELGIGRIVLLDQRFPLEYCDDCGAPLYPNPDGEPVHAELPEEDGPPAARHLH